MIKSSVKKYRHGDFLSPFYVQKEDGKNNRRS